MFQASPVTLPGRIHDPPALLYALRSRVREPCPPVALGRPPGGGTLVLHDVGLRFAVQPIFRGGIVVSFWCGLQAGWRCPGVVVVSGW